MHRAAKQCAAHLECIIWEVRYGQSLHVGRGIREREDKARGGQLLVEGSPSLGGEAEPPDEEVGDGVVEAEVGVRHEIQRDGHLQSASSLLKLSLGRPSSERRATP